MVPAFAQIRARSALARRRQAGLVVVTFCLQRVELVGLQTHRQREEALCLYALSGPLQERFIVVLLTQSTEPDRFPWRKYHHYVLYIAGAETATDAQVERAQQFAAFPLGLEPFDGNGRVSLVGVPAATAQTDKDMSDDHAL